MNVIYGAGGHGRDIHHFLGWPMVDDNPALGLPPGDPKPYVAGVNDPRCRKQLAGKLERAGWRPVGDGTVIFPGVHRGPDVVLGPHVHVNRGAFLTRCNIGPYTTVGPNATVCGDVRVGACCAIGAGAVIKNLVTVGDHVTIGAGAVVVADLPYPGVYVGVPARRIDG